MNPRAPIRTIKRERQITTKEKYEELQAKFINGEFTYDAHCLIQKLTEKGKSQPHMEGVQLYRILIEISKVLMLNELQILFLGATIQEMKWKIIDPCLNAYLDGFKGLSPKLKTDAYGKKMQLSLLLIGYIVKMYLNEEITTYEQKMRELITINYDKMYQEWVEKMKKNFKFLPKNMNKLFKELDIIRAKKTVELDDLNYNQKVEELFSKYIEENNKDYVSKEEESNPIEEEEVEDQPIVPPNIIRDSSIQSMRSLTQRQSFQSVLNRDHFMGRNISFLRNTSQDEFIP